MELFFPHVSAIKNTTVHNIFIKILLRLLKEWRGNLDNNFFVVCLLMDLSKAFDCVPHDFLTAKLAAYGFGINFLCYIYSYFTNRKQFVSINNATSAFNCILSGVPG